MGWRIVVITKHSKISYRMENIIIQTDDDIFQIPISDIQILLIATTKAVVTSHLMMELAKKDIKVIFTDNKQMPVGEFNTYYSNLSRNKNISKQINWRQERKGIIWQSIIKMKIENEAKLLAKYNRQKYNGQPGSKDLEYLISEIEIDDLTNREAVAARMYFQRLFDTSFNRRNEKVVVNGFLNFGYTVLLSLITQEICCAGYLTELCIHHSSCENFYNLSSDFIEPFRFLVDELAFHKSESNNFCLDDKLEIIDLLNKTVSTNEGDAILSSVIRSFVRRSLKYLSEETEVVPSIEFKI